MDEREGIPHRDAIAGLSLLGLLFAGLVGTIVFRIVNAQPRHTTTAPAATWATNAGDAPASPLPLNGTLAPSDDRYATSPPPTTLPTAAPIPTTEDGSTSIPAESITPAPIEIGQPVQQAPVEPVRPRFLAPSNR
jgi:hypothetical protein